MKAIRSRIRRIIGALADPMSYRLFWYSQMGRLISPDMPNDEVGAGTEVDALDTMKPADDGKISRVIFQTTESRRKMPPSFKYWSATFCRKNPDFSYSLWDTVDDREFISRKFPWFLEKYDSYPRDSFRLDIVRSFFLYAYGGFYAHMDAECLKPLESIRGAGDVLLGRMGYNSDFEQSIPNAIMASKPRQAFWLLTVAIAVERLVELQSEASDEFPPERVTGPIMLKNAVDFYINYPRQAIIGRVRKACPELEVEIQRSDFGNIRIFSSPILCPINWNDFMQAAFRKRMSKYGEILEEAAARQLFPHAYTVTYWNMDRK
jgi:hypothetical protein